MVTLVSTDVNHSIHSFGDTLAMDAREELHTYADRLRWAIAASGKKKSALIEKLAITRAAVNKLLRLDGSSETFNTVNNSLAAIFLGVSTDWLATGLGPRQRDYKWQADTIMLATAFERLEDPGARRQALSVLAAFINPGVDDTRIPAAFDARGKEVNAATVATPPANGKKRDKA